MAKVEALYVSEGSMEPMLSKDFVELIAGKGIVGDRYGEGCGTYTCFKEPGRQLTLISGDSFDELATGLPDAPPIGNLRRNVVVRGMTATQLRGHIGSELLLGADCRVFLHRSCVPCKYNERLNKCPGLEEHFWDVSGVNCEVLTSGRLSVGNIVTPVPNSVDLYRVNDGGKPLEFFVRPSKRRPGYQKRLAGPGQVPEAVRRAYDAVGAPLAGSGNSMLTNCRAVLMTLVAVFITVMLHGRFIAEI